MGERRQELGRTGDGRGVRRMEEESEGPRQGLDVLAAPPSQGRRRKQRPEEPGRAQVLRLQFTLPSQRIRTLQGAGGVDVLAERARGILGVRGVRGRCSLR